MLGYTGSFASMLRIFPAYWRTCAVLLLLTTIPSASCCNQWMESHAFHFLPGNPMTHRCVNYWKPPAKFQKFQSSDFISFSMISFWMSFFRSSRISLCKKMWDLCSMKGSTCLNGFKSKEYLHNVGHWRTDNMNERSILFCNRLNIYSVQSGISLLDSINVQHQLVLRRCRWKAAFDKGVAAASRD